MPGYVRFFEAFRSLKPICYGFDMIRHVDWSVCSLLAVNSLLEQLET